MILKPPSSMLLLREEVRVTLGLETVDILRESMLSDCNLSKSPEGD